MPHIIVKMYPGRPESKKEDLTREIVKSVVKVTECAESAVSVAIEEIDADNWAQAVYKPDILNCPGKLYQEPDYNPFEDPKENKENKTDGLMQYVRESAVIAQQEDTSDFFSPMSWLDLQIEDTPEIFDIYFETPWHELSENEKGERAMAIRRVL